MKFRAILFISFLYILSVNTYAGSGSMSKTCSGNIRVCDYSIKPIKCSKQYFYLYAYQYAYIYDGELQNENHSFIFSGALGNKKDYELSHLFDNHLVYDSLEFSLAIPYKSSMPIYVKQKGALDGPEQSDNWKVLCNN